MRMNRLTLCAWMRIVRIMVTPETIRVLEERLRASGIRVDDLCSRAGVNRGTWQRWKAGKTTPHMANWDRVLKTVAALSEAA